MQRIRSSARIGRTCTVSTSFCSFSDGRRGFVFMSREHNKVALVCPANSHNLLPSYGLVRSVYSSWLERPSAARRTTLARMTSQYGDVYRRVMPSSSLASDNLTSRKLTWHHFADSAYLDHSTCHNVQYADMETKDYPRTLLEFDDRFSTEQACWDYLCRVHWPDGFVGVTILPARPQAVGDGGVI